VTYDRVFLGVLITGLSLVISMMGRRNNLDDTSFLEDPAGKVIGESSVSSLQSRVSARLLPDLTIRDSRLPISGLDLLSPVLVTQGSSTAQKSNPDIIPRLQSANQRSLSSSLNRSLSSLSTTYNSLDCILIGRELPFITDIGGLGRMGYFD
jgi:hypothetical protein